MTVPAAIFLAVFNIRSFTSALWQGFRAAQVTQPRQEDPPFFRSASHLGQPVSRRLC